MINIYSPAEIAVIRKGGKILADVLQRVLVKVAPDVTTLGLDRYTDELISAAGAKPSFKMEKGYHFATCMNINDMVVHGIPTNYKLQEGDVLGVDVGVYYRGFHTDASWTVKVRGQRIENRGQIADETDGMDKFLETGKRALERAVKKCVPGNHVGDISKAIQETVEGAGYACVKQLVGHGIGRELHEDPEIPCYLRGRIENTPVIKKGMVLATEVIYNLGQPQVIYGSDDGWTIVTRDRKPSGLFEHTVAVTANEPEILTLASGA